MAKTYQTVIIDGKKYTKEIDSQEDAAIRSFMVSDKVQASLGMRLDSYAARVEQGNSGPMSSAKNDQNHKNGLSSNQRIALRIRQRQAEIKRKGR